MVPSLRIPIGEPLTFDRLKQLNATVSAEELAAAFPYLPQELREQAWSAMRLQIALDAWGGEIESEEAD